MSLSAISALAGWWYHSTADLDVVRGSAKARGIPTTWAETGAVLSSADQIARFKRLLTLAGSLKDYESAVAVRSPTAPRLKPFLPIPKEARDHHAGLDPGTLAEFLDLIDQLPRQSITLRSEWTARTVLDDIDGERQATRLMGERVLLGSRETLPTETRRLLALITARDHRALIELLVHVSLLAIATDRIAGRLSDLKADMPDLPDLLEQTAEQLKERLIAVTIGEFVLVLHTVQHLDEMTALTSGTPSSDWERLSQGVMVRAGRQALLEELMAWVDQVRRRPTADALVVAANVLMDQNQRLRHWMPSESQVKMMVGSMAMIWRSVAHAELRLRLLVAELRGTSWPNDVFDPAGGPLKRVERDGSLMGAYTVYENSVDDGGDPRKDRYLPLYGLQFAPKP